MHVPRYESATRLFVGLGLPNLDVIVRKTLHSLMIRLETSSNSLIQAVIHSEVRNQSEIWRKMQESVGGAMHMWF